MRSPSTGAVEELSSALFPAGQPGPPAITSLVEGLRMVSGYSHQPVLVDEVVALFSHVPPGVVVDGTVGGGGHAAALLEAYPALRVLGLDRDREALQAAAERLAPYGRRAVVRHARFGDLASEVRAAFAATPDLWSPEGGTAGAHEPTPAPAPEGEPPLSGVLLDLGVSSPQLDRPARGFSYRSDGPLDMRMDPETGSSAMDLVNNAGIEELAELFEANGEVRLGRRIARAVVAARPLTTTSELAAAVVRAVPAAGRRKGHPARRVFQALRIAVNAEVEELSAVLPSALDLLSPGGRLVVISYHSGEDRAVKEAMTRAATGGCACPPGLPCVCGATVRHRLVLRGSRRPSSEELAANPRARSARLRAVQRLPEER
jgi:16S rRNA (cytosine1402-N4)-methyltransferase